MIETQVALCVDCDGTLVRTDLFHEALLRVLKHRPWLIFSMLVWLMHGKAYFKNRIAELEPLEPATLPIRREVLAMIHAARDQGRPIVLATAADLRHAEVLAAHLGLFDHVLATSPQKNFSAHAKAEALAERFGERGFDYVGDSRADLPVWARARKAYVVGDRGGVARRIRGGNLGVERVAEEKANAIASLLKALRPHQWLKNLLVFAPVMAAHAFTITVWTETFCAFVAFSLCASAVYVLNDLLDVDADRVHPTKARRPFAAGKLSISTGLLLSPLMFIAGAMIAYLVRPLFLVVLLGYAVTTTAYSVRLKRQVMVDVILLATLYTTRIIGGSAAASVTPSFWLLAFSMFLFLSLALVKRYSELLPLLAAGGAPAGRGYRADDLPVLLAAGVACGMNAVMVLAFYVDAAGTRDMYPSATAILLAPVFLLYWVGRLWLKAHRGEVHEDPVVFAARDWQTLAIAACLAVLFAIARSPLLA